MNNKTYTSWKRQRAPEPELGHKADLNKAEYYDLKQRIDWLSDIAGDRHTEPWEREKANGTMAYIQRFILGDPLPQCGDESGDCLCGKEHPHHRKIDF